MRKLIALLAIVVLVLSLALVAGITAGADRPASAQAAATATGKGFSAVKLSPDAAEALRAQGRAFGEPFPATASKGKKFNPSGGTVERLETAAEQNVLVLFVDFNTAPPGSTEDRINLKMFDDMLFSELYDPWVGYDWTGEVTTYTTYPKDRTLYNYYKEVSYDFIVVGTKDVPSMRGWLPSGHDYDWYVNNDNGFGAYPKNVQGLVMDALEEADAQGVDFSVYAVNGVIPNLFVVFAGTGAEWSGDPSLIWSHSWALSVGTDLTVADRTFDGIVIDNYAMMPEVGGDLTNFTRRGVSGPYPPTVGVFAHEYGHVLGLPDQYDYGYESEGTGIYSLMAGGSWNRYPDARIFSGNSPSHLDAWSKIQLGIAEPTVVENLEDATLGAAEKYPDFFKMVVPGSDGKEYFLFENRQQVGFDQGFGQYGPGVHGLAIYHVDETVFDRNYWRPNEAENWQENRSAGFRKAWTGETHYGVSIIQADDAWHLEHGVYWTGFQGDLYPGVFGRTSFGVNTLPNSGSYYWWPSAPKFGQSGVTATNIVESASGDDGLRTITVDLSIAPWTPGKK